MRPQHAVTISFRQIAQNKQQGQTLVVDTWSSKEPLPQSGFNENCGNPN